MYSIRLFIVVMFVQYGFGKGIDESSGLPHGNKTQIGHLWNPTAVEQSLGIKTVWFRDSSQSSVERFSICSRGRRCTGLFAGSWRHRLHLRLVGQVCGIRSCDPIWSHMWTVIHFPNAFLVGCRARPTREFNRTWYFRRIIRCHWS